VFPEVASNFSHLTAHDDLRTQSIEGFIAGSRSCLAC
jgi:hypothetical protein